MKTPLNIVGFAMLMASTSTWAGGLPSTSAIDDASVQTKARSLVSVKGTGDSASAAPNVERNTLRASARGTAGLGIRSHSGDSRATAGAALGVRALGESSRLAGSSSDGLLAAKARVSDGVASKVRVGLAGNSGDRLLTAKARVGDGVASKVRVGLAGNSGDRLLAAKARVGDGLGVKARVGLLGSGGSSGNSLATARTKVGGLAGAKVKVGVRSTAVSNPSLSAKVKLGDGLGASARIGRGLGVKARVGLVGSGSPYNHPLATDRVNSGTALGVKARIGGHGQLTKVGTKTGGLASGGTGIRARLSGRALLDESAHVKARVGTAASAKLRVANGLSAKIGNGANQMIGTGRGVAAKVVVATGSPGDPKVAIPNVTAKANLVAGSGLKSPGGAIPVANQPGRSGSAPSGAAAPPRGTPQGGSSAAPQMAESRQGSTVSRGRASSGQGSSGVIWPYSKNVHGDGRTGDREHDD